MKTSIRLLFIFLTTLAIAGLSSCSKVTIDNGIGTAEFSLNLPGGSGLTKSAESDSLASYQLMVSVEDTKGNPVLTDKLIPLYVFGTGFLSAKVEIKNGEFRLTKFMLMNPSGVIVYAAPMKGSPIGYLASKPLPITFNIFPDKITNVLPEVLAVGDQPATQFGYTNFGVQVIKPLEFWTECILGYDNPMIMATIQITNAKLTISNNTGWIYSFKLTAAVNHLVIRGGSEKYTFQLEKEGYPAQKMEFTSVQLLAATKENPLILKILIGSSLNQVLFLQPDSVTGKDAMISNIEPDKNFGAYKYFEATYMSEPTLTVMRTNNSLIWFDLSKLPKSAIIKKVVLRLSYDLPIAWDSTIYAGTTNTKVGGRLQQIIEPWEENGVTWNKQPKTTEANQVFIPPFIRNVNFIEVDVTGLFVTTAANLLPNYGMMFKLYPEQKFKGFRFASSDFSVATMRPGLTIQYTSSK
jgi:hypothetical protein